MHVCDLNDTTPIGRWHVNWGRVCNNYDDANEVIRTHRPMLRLSLRELFPLNEITYKEMANAIDPTFLSQGLRAQALRGVRYASFDHDTMVFYVTSSEIDVPGTRGFQREYLNLVKFLGWDEIGGDPDLTPREKALMLLWTSDIQVHCDDPSFLYWGYQYICSQLGASIYPETRRPDVRNMGLKGIVCKHLNRVLRSLPFYNGDIARAVTEQWGGKIDRKALDAIRQRMDLTAQANQTPPEPEVPETDEPNAAGVPAPQL